jgi:hypothetical protein
MKHFTIETETNNITIYGSAKEADAVPDSERFSNEAALAKLAANWSAARLVEIWNSLPGETPVKKFKDRATAVRRIWKAIQGLGQAEPVAAAAVEPVTVAETAAVADQPQEVSETVQSGAVTPESPAPAKATDVAPQSPSTTGS